MSHLPTLPLQDSLRAAALDWTRSPQRGQQRTGGSEAERLPARRSWLVLPENSQPVVKRWEGERAPL